MRVSIPSRPVLEPVPRGTEAPWLDANANKLRLVEPFSVIVDGQDFLVPSGFITDGFSTPRIVWWAFPPGYSPGFSAAVFHDWCYALGDDSGLSKAQADRAFRELMIEDGAAKPVAYLFWLGVRANLTGGNW